MKIQKIKSKSYSTNSTLHFNNDLFFWSTGSETSRPPPSIYILIDISPRVIGRLLGRSANPRMDQGLRDIQGVDGCDFISRQIGVSIYFSERFDATVTSDNALYLYILPLQYSDIKTCQCEPFSMKTSTSPSLTFRRQGALFKNSI